MNLRNENYADSLNKFLSFVEPIASDNIYNHALEAKFESMRDWSVFHTLEDVKTWFINRRRASTLEVQHIPLASLSDWDLNENTGDLAHKSGDFFTVKGLRVKVNSREREFGWDQPILEQVGLDGGILGIIRQRFNGIPHYLCEAKEEPGNYGKVQISPSLQATFANLNQAHGGRKPNFADLFLNLESDTSATVLFDSWLAEDGGRLHLKRNRGILIEVADKVQVHLPNENFIWLSLFQIKALMVEDAWINPHVRGILAHV